MISVPTFHPFIRKWLEAGTGFGEGYKMVQLLLSRMYFPLEYRRARTRVKERQTPDPLDKKDRHPDKC